MKTSERQQEKETVGKKVEGQREHIEKIYSAIWLNLFDAPEKNETQRKSRAKHFAHTVRRVNVNPGKPEALSKPE